MTRDATDPVTPDDRYPLPIFVFMVGLLVLTIRLGHTPDKAREANEHLFAALHAWPTFRLMKVASLSH